MKISKDSWHYRFNDFAQDSFDYRARTELFTTCSYIRTTAFSFLVTLIRSLGIIMAVAILLWMLAGMVTLPLVVLGVVAKTSSVIGSLVGFGVAGWLFTGVMVIGYIVEKLAPVLRRRKERRMSLLKQSLQDKKNGVCTLVEFE